MKTTIILESVDELINVSVQGREVGDTSPSISNKACIKLGNEGLDSRICLAGDDRFTFERPPTVRDFIKILAAKHNLKVID